MTLLTVVEHEYCCWLISDWRSECGCPKVSTECCSSLRPGSEWEMPFPRDHTMSSASLWVSHRPIMTSEEGLLESRQRQSSICAVVLGRGRGRTWHRLCLSC